jgi:hypothetical protein
MGTRLQADITSQTDATKQWIAREVGRARDLEARERAAKNGLPKVRRALAQFTSVRGADTTKYTIEVHFTSKTTYERFGERALELARAAAPGATIFGTYPGNVRGCP